MFLSTRIEQNPKVKIALSAVLALLIFLFVINGMINAPDPSSVAGTYRNECCSDVVIVGIRLSYGNRTVWLDLRNMKFGMTGYVKGQFTKNTILESDEDAAITFSGTEKRRIISMPIDKRDYTFQLVQH